MKKATLKDYPILRLTIPLATGIFFMREFQLSISMEVMLLALIGVSVMLGLSLCIRSFTHRWWFGFLLFGFFFGIGMYRMKCQWEAVNVNWPEDKDIYAGVVTEPTIEKNKSICCKVSLEQGPTIYLYVAKDSMARQVEMGDCLLFYTQVREPSNEGLTFDYASYLKSKGISGTAYVANRHWYQTGQQLSLGWKQKALLVRERIIGWYKEWGIGGDELPVLSALTVGYKDDLSDELRNQYASAGISHVLALSGMHIGFLWLLIHVALKPLDRVPFRKIKWLVSAMLLWAFAFIAGLEASVVRAVIMCMLLEWGRVSGRNALSIHTLSIAAFFMLLYNPFYLYDVGFQLSFIAVLSILMFYRHFHSVCPSTHALVRRVWSIMCVSMAAQLGTAPLVMYYFSNFSVYFLLANIMVALLVPCIIYMAFATVVLVGCPWIHAWMVRGLDFMVGTLNALAGWVSALPDAVWSSSRLHQVEVWAIYGVVGVWWCHLTIRRRMTFFILLASLVVWLGLHCWLLLK